MQKFLEMGHPSLIINRFLADNLVDDFISEDTKSWKLENIASRISQMEVAAIKAIPVFVTKMED